MWFRFASSAFAVAFIAATAVARAAAPTRVDVRADVVAFYPYADATTIAASGHVIAQTGTHVIRANVLQYDVGKARILASGDVTVTHGTRITHGEAYRIDLETGAATIVRVEPSPASFAVPDDASAPEVERRISDTDFKPLDLDGQRPYIRSRHALVAPGASVRMTPAEFPTGAGPALAVPTYLYTLVQNQNLAQNASPGASFDQPYNLFGSPNSLTAAHLRYESQNGVTLAIDNRLVDRNRAYAVTSLLPFRNRRADFLAYQQLRPGLQQTFTASHTFGSSHVEAATYRLQGTNRLSIATLTASAYATTNTLEFALGTIPHDIGHYVSYQLRTGYAYDHALYGFPYANDFRTFVGGYATLPGATVLGTTLNARYDYQLSGYDFPHQTTSGTLTLSAGHVFSRGVNVYATASYLQSANRYRENDVARRALGLPNPNYPVITPDGTPFLGYFAYAGASTYRTYRIESTFQGRRGDDRLQLTLTHARDFPQFNGYGRPPLTASIDITRRITPTIRLAIGRSYTFGWANRYLSPQYTFSISP